MQDYALLVTIFVMACSYTTGQQHLEWCDYFRRLGQTNRPECVVQGTISAAVCQSRPNEIYMDCGSPCPATCTDQRPNCAAIAHNCVVNCFCSPGFVRDMNKPNQPCVQPQQCATIQSCPAGEIFKACGSACQPTCLVRNPVCQSTACYAGCFCQDGFIRRKENDICVPFTQCTNNQCPVNEVYQQCGSACPSTCQSRNPTCAQVCVPGCFCSPGFIRDLANGRSNCVAPNMCSTGATACAATEQYLSCGTPCPPTCNNRSPMCQHFCVAGCFCLPGYVRNIENVCILPQFCPITASKAGTCPTPSNNLVRAPLTIECSGDYDCSGTMKCCSEVSGSRFCRYPVGTQSVYTCPAAFSAFNSYNVINCVNDNNCPANQRCCAEITGRKICADVNEQGTTKMNITNRMCPVNPPRDCQSEPIVISCSNDSDCDNNWKCCQATFCGGRICKEGVLVTAPNK
uniref:WAP domain-containing protein n=1 Tax=Plectus sambesii TaxID=2011161 RepID=A0A914X341_9BILA